MRKLVLPLLLAVLVVPAIAAQPTSAPVGSAARGAKLAALGGCASCHTGPDKVPYAGGHAIETLFGTFYGPNLTQDPVDGIGAWTYDDFRTAMRDGRDRDGAPYYPAFPYPSFTKMSEQDLADLWAFLKTIKPVKKADVEQAALQQYASRLVIATWRSLEFSSGAFRPDPKASAAVNRGAYLAQAVAHCGECHTPRNHIGGLIEDRWFGGSDAPPQRAPNITPSKRGIGGWSDDDLLSFLRTGLTPEGDVTGGEMGRLIREGTSKLSDEDLRALVAYLRSVPPLD